MERSPLLLYLLFVLICSMVQKSVAQKELNVDSLIRVSETTQNDSLKVHILNQLAFHFIFNDTEKASRYIEKGMKHAHKTGANFGQSQLLNTKGIYFDVLGMKDSANFYFTKALTFCRTHHFRHIETMSLNNLGMFHWGNSQFDKALSFFYQALEMNKTYFPEKENSRATYENNIGLIYQELKQFDKAIDFHKQSLATRKKLGLISDQAVSLANLGVCYQNQNLFEKAKHYFLKAIQLSKQAENLRLYHSLHGNLATIYAETDQYELAIDHYKIALNRPESIGENPKSDLNAYIHLASTYNKMKNPRQALTYAQKGMDLLENNPQLYNFSGDLHYALAESYYQLGQIEKGQQSMSAYKSVLDSIFSQQTAESIAESEAKYQTAEKEILLLEKEQIIQQNNLERQRFFIWLFALAGLVIGVSAVLVLLYKQKKAADRQASLEMQLAEQQKVAQIQDERIRISRELHDNIGSYLTLLSATVEQNDPKVKTWEESKISTFKEILSISMRELRKTVWLLNKTSITVEEIVIRLRDFLKPLNQNNRNVRINLVGEGTEKLSEIQTTHLFRIIQEAVSNAVKHANCTEIVIDINVQSENRICVNIHDNGKGFDPLPTTEGNGLNNLKLRVEELQGTLSISSDLNLGTHINVCFPL